MSAEATKRAEWRLRGKNRTRLNQGDELRIESVDEGWIALGLMVLKQVEWDVKHGLRTGFVTSDGRQLRAPHVGEGSRTGRMFEDMHSLQALEWLNSPVAVEFVQVLSAAGGFGLHRDFFLRRLSEYERELETIEDVRP